MNNHNPVSHIIFESESYIAVAKAGGIPTLPDVTGDLSLLEEIRKLTGHDLYPINRIDRPVSGIVLYGKNKKGAALLSSQFKHGQVQKRYLALTVAKLQKDSSALVHFHKRNALKRKADIRREQSSGYNKVKLTYDWIESSDRYHLYHIFAEHGRFHQIRAQLAMEGAIIKGDVKYGARRRNKDRSVDLHAWTLTFKCPDSGRKKTLVAPPPNNPLWNFFLPSVSKIERI